jgi:preprotein translocase subunit SecA
MVIHAEKMVQRELNFAIVDEVDSILVDEARTPLIISGGEKAGANLYVQANTFVKSLVEEDYDIDVKSKHISLNENGMAKAEHYFGIENLYDVKYVTLVHRINNALKANYTMFKDVDYVVQDNTVIIVDSFTGRLMHGRQFSEGLHQALEAKEHVEIKKETRTLATITFQNFFRMYHKLAGMTGTAKTEEEEFRNIYNMFVVEIPTNAPVRRIDAEDVMFATMEGKFKAIAKDIAIRHQKGQPVLVGTISIETSELLSNLLKKRGIPHNVLNAKQHEREAEIVAKAGEKGAVTIATNMAGRGTDIKLGEGVRELGGLAVIGTERHESRRIDNQLRGRSGRQGDPGYSCFYLSAEDDLLKRFGSDRFKMIVNMGTGKGKDEEGNELPLQMKVLSKFIEGAQRKVEGFNFDNRKSVVEYDEVLRKQREVIYKQRNDILLLDDMEPVVHKMMASVVSRKVPTYFTMDRKQEIFDSEHFNKEFIMRFFNLGNVEEDEFEDKSSSELQEYILNKFHANLAEKKEIVPIEQYREFLKVVLLKVVDRYWMDHIDQMSSLRQSIRLQSYAQLNPLREYQEIGYEMFTNMIASIEDDVVQLINRAQVQQNLQREEVAKPTGTSGGSDEPVKRRPVKAADKVGRNDPCPCGSGRKYKHCCGANQN